ncbi:MAG: hypothetical protein AB7I04_11035 [Pseudomonadales bacterium]
MSRDGDRPGKESRLKKLKKRRATATVGGTTQSGFASRSMSDLMKQGGSAPAGKPAEPRGEKSQGKQDPDEGKGSA